MVIFKNFAPEAAELEAGVTGRTASEAPAASPRGTWLPWLVTPTPTPLLTSTPLVLLTFTLDRTAAIKKSYSFTSTFIYAAQNKNIEQINSAFVSYDC